MRREESCDWSGDELVGPQRHREDSPATNLRRQLRFINIHGDRLLGDQIEEGVPAWLLGAMESGRRSGRSLEKGEGLFEERSLEEGELSFKEGEGTGNGKRYLKEGESLSRKVRRLGTGKNL